MVTTIGGWPAKGDLTLNDTPAPNQLVWLERQVDG
jgi:hypothetical protein